MSDTETPAYLVALYNHAHWWASKQYCMTDQNAHHYASWYVQEYGNLTNPDWAPPHSGQTIFKYARLSAQEAS